MSQPPAADRLRARKLPDGSPAYFETLAAYGDSRGVTRAAASKWNRAGDIVWVEDDEGRRRSGLIDAVATDARRGAVHNPVKRKAPARAAAPLPDPGDDDRDDAEDELPLTPPPSRRALPPADPLQATAAQAKAGSAVIDYKTKHLDFQQRLGNLVPKSEVQLREADRMNRLSEAILRIAVEAADLANPDDPARARKAFQEASRRVIERFIGDEMARLDAEEAEDEREGADPVEREAEVA